MLRRAPADCPPLCVPSGLCPGCRCPPLVGVVRDEVRDEVLTDRAEGGEPPLLLTPRLLRLLLRGRALRLSYPAAPRRDRSWSCSGLLRPAPPAGLATTVAMELSAVRLATDVVSSTVCQAGSC
eukprot:SAG22_NODE_6992_length_787_cov_1.305233_2_plen_123_part_01